MELHAELPFRMSQAVRDGPPHVVDGARAVCRSKHKLSKPLSSTGLAGCRLRPHELSSCPGLTACPARFADANPVTTLAGTGSLLFVSTRRGPDVVHRLHEIVELQQWF